MRLSIFGYLLAAAALALPGVAAGYTCYLVYDRNDSTIYRDMLPPVDMSVRGTAAREALRNRGELLLIIETDRCAPISFVTGPGGSGALNLDNMVGSVPDAMPTGNVTGSGPRPGSSTPNARSGASSAAPPSGPAASRSYGK